MNLKYISLITINFLFLFGCGENPEQNIRTYNGITKSIIVNYNKKKDVFDNLIPYFAFKHIKYIEFKNSKIATIQYQLGNEIGTRAWQKLENKDINSTDIKHVLDLDSLSINDLLQIKDNLSTINADNLWVIDNYDAIRGRYTKELDFRYAQSMNGLHFFYRIFQEPLNLMPDNSANLLTNNGTTGGILGNNVVWYSK